METFADWLEWLGLIALAFGASAATHLLGLLTKLAGKPFGNRPQPYLGGALYLTLLLGLPVLIVAWGFASGRLPAY